MEDELTPRTSRTGLYVAGAAVLAAGWLAALKFSDPLPESRTERRLLSARANPSLIPWWE